MWCHEATSFSHVWCHQVTSLSLCVVARVASTPRVWRSASGRRADMEMLTLGSGREVHYRPEADV